MHPWRRNILYRWIFALVVVLGVGGWLVYDWYETPPPVVDRPRPEVGKLELPKAQETAALKNAITVIRELSDKAPVMVAEPSSSLLDTELVEEKVQIQLGMIFLGDASRYATLNEHIYKQGQALDEYRRLVTVAPESVDVDDRGSVDRIYWEGPQMVALVKAQPQTAAENATEEQGEGRIPDELEKDPETREAMPETLKQAVDDIEAEAKDNVARGKRTSMSPMAADMVPIDSGEHQ